MMEPVFLDAAIRAAPILNFYKHWCGTMCGANLVSSPFLDSPSSRRVYYLIFHLFMYSHSQIHANIVV